MGHRLWLLTDAWHGNYNTHYVRVDEFFCEKCLGREEKRFDEYKREAPHWFKG